MVMSCREGGRDINFLFREMSPDANNVYCSCGNNYKSGNGYVSTCHQI